MNKENKTVNWLFNPFVYVAGWKALIIGLIAILAAGYVGSFSNTHFDGVLDTHSGRATPLWFFFSAGIINWLCMGIVLWIFGKFASKTPFRAIDVFGTQALSRWPTLFTALATLPPAYTRFSRDLIQFSRTQKFPEGFAPIDAVVFGLAVLIMLLVLGWMVRLMYKAYSVSCNLSGGKSIRTFVGGILIAEVISKVAIVLLLKQF